MDNELWSGGGLPEAPASVNFILVSPHGLSMQWTLRDKDENDLYERLVAFMKLRTSQGYTYRTSGQNPPLTAPAQAEAVRGETPTPLTPAQPTNGNQTPITVMVERFEVGPRADGKLDCKFYAAGHKYTDVTAVWNPGQAAGMLAKTGAWTPEHFVKLASYDVSWVLEWVPSEKLNTKGMPYKNVSSVRLRGAQPQPT